MTYLQIFIAAVARGEITEHEAAAWFLSHGMRPSFIRRYFPNA
jgi:hypothetical protein